MRIGIIADIHEDATALKTALDVLDKHVAGIVITLGDIVGESTSQLGKTVRLLLDVGAVGVWGNHEFGLAHEPDPSVFQGLPPCVREFMTALKPTIQLGDCFFSHVEPWLDPYKLEHLWRSPYDFSVAEHVAKSFKHRTERLLFYGHIHCWRIATPNGIVDWDGDQICLAPPQRYLIAVGPLSDGLNATQRQGHFALYDTLTHILKRFRVVENDGFGHANGAERYIARNHSANSRRLTHGQLEHRGMPAELRRQIW
jgi:predicted phosphodiesterase